MSKKILIVDDDMDIVRAMEVSLSSALGPAVLILRAHSAAEAIDIAWQKKPDVMILDYLLSGENGSDVILEVANGAIQAICGDRIIVITGDDKSHETFVSALGVDNYLSKPFKMRDLIAKVKEILKKPKLRLNTS